MINKIMRLVYPKKFDVFYKEEKLVKDYIIIRPTYLSICKADQRYYNGSRREEVLKEKLPMALIHEGIGVVLFDPRKEFSIGDRVVIIPNIPRYIIDGKSKQASYRGYKTSDNYYPDSLFRSSNCDGFMQELIIHPREMVMKIPSSIPNELASFIELMSVSIHAINRFKYFSKYDGGEIGIWGDGNLGYITALFCKICFPMSKIYIFGKHEQKLKLFSFADDIITVYAKDTPYSVNHAFECVGGNDSERAINQMINTIKPGGTINLLGVSENRISINTRKILEKGISIIGHSRSCKSDFELTINTLESNELIDKLLILVSNIIKVRNIEDAIMAFEVDKIKIFGKTIMEWNF